MLNWLHHLFNPHCESCALAQERERMCNSCQTLQLQLDIANREKERLLSLLIEKQTAKPELPTLSEEKPVSIGSRYIPTAVRQQMLERESRVAAQILRDKNRELQNLDELEQQVIGPIELGSKSTNLEDNNVN